MIYWFRFSYDYFKKQQKTTKNVSDYLEILKTT